MALVVCDGGRLIHAAYLRTALNADSFLRLFTNNHAPAHGDTAASFIQASFGGYAQITLTAWGAPSFLGDRHAQLQEVIHTWICTAAPFTETVYGYYVVDGLGALQWAELAVTPMPIDGLLKAYTVLPVYTYTSETGA